MLNSLFSIFRPRAAALPAEKPPKLPSSEQVIPKFLGKTRGATVSDKTNNITNTALSAFTRSEATMGETIKKLVLASPDLFSTVMRKIGTAVTTSYTVIAYDEAGRVDEQATELMQAFTRRLDFGAPDYTKFYKSTDFRSLASSLLYDNLRYGAMGLEVVLGKGRIPSHLKPIAARLLKWADDTPGTYPIYKGPDADVPLNFPTVFYTATMQDSESPYADSPLQAAIQACLWDFEFTDALRKAAIKNLLGRLVVTIESENFRKTVPLTIQSDAKAMKEYMDATVAQLEDQLNNLQPEDALVVFDSLSVTTVQDKNRSEDKSIAVLKDLINGRITAGASILPSVIGRGEGSSAASMEAQLFVSSATKLQQELNIIFSRALTLVAKVFGKAVTVQFKYAEANLRPELELASFKAVDQATVLEQLSLGFISDIEASIRLTGTLPPKGFKPLSGTMFKTASPNDGGTNDYSNTSAGTGEGKPNSTQSQKDSGDTKSPGVKSK